MRMQCGLGRSVLSCVALLSISSLAVRAAEPENRRPLRPGEFNPAHEAVDLFDGMKQGRLEVRVIPKDTTGGKVLITNKTDKPLNVKLPEAFAAVHVLAQLGGGMVGGVGGGMGQAMGGGGMGGMGGGGGLGGGAGGGMFNIAPEKVGSLNFVGVCLEHGKPDPRAVMKYEIRPLEAVTTKPEIREMLKMLGRGECSLRVAQILAWHVNNEMSWQELAGKTIKHLDGTSEPYFTAAEIQAAMRLDDYVAKQIEDRKSGKQLPKL